MGRTDVLTQEQAWEAFDRWLQDDRVGFLEEPAGLDTPFRELTRSRSSSTKDWADSYLAAFALTSQLTLVTFDRAFRSRTRQLVLLNE